ncbi:RapZ C-terminal domain-containing protein [Desulfocastanea catecholica]
MGDAEQLRVVLYSFGFKYGDPVDVNLVWDVRFLPNPYWVVELRPKTGRVKDVADYVLQSAEAQTFFHHLEPLLQFLVKQNSAAGKKTLRIAFGCTGGRHRSVAVTEKIAAFLGKLPVQLTVFHRDIAKDGDIND